MSEPVCSDSSPAALDEKLSTFAESLCRLGVGVISRRLPMLIARIPDDPIKLRNAFVFVDLLKKSDYLDLPVSLPSRPRALAEGYGRIHVLKRIVLVAMNVETLWCR